MRLIHESFQWHINRILYTFHEVEKAYDKEILKTKVWKRFLKYNLVISGISNLLGRRNLTSMIPKLNNSKNMKG